MAVPIRPLDGIRVLDLASYVSGPYTCQLLADLGAEVIKVENPAGGDPFRGKTESSVSALFASFNINKKSVTLNFTKPAGAAVFKRLVRKSDVIVENFRPGVMDRAGLTWEVLSAENPRLVYCSITGFGKDGPYRHRPAYDSVPAALSGYYKQIISPRHLEITGPAVADATTGLYAAYGVLGALMARNASGKGCRVDVSMVESMLGFIRDSVTKYIWTGKTTDPLERPSQSQCYALHCADGKAIAIHMSYIEKFWDNLLTAMERPELKSDPRFLQHADRQANYQALAAELAKAFATKPRGEWAALLDKFDIPYAPINDYAEVMADPQIRHLNTFSTFDQAGKGPVQGLKRPVFYDGTRDEQEHGAPLLGEHNDAILREIGVGEAELAALRAEKLI